MPKRHTSWVCQECGTSSPAYLGKCPGCGEWHSMVEQVDQPAARSGRARSGSAASATKPIPISQVDVSTSGRISLGIDEFDRVLGGGVVPGSVILIGGDPGVGKSTLILQAAGEMSKRGLTVLYVSAEESAQQVRVRADRMGVSGETLLIHPEIDLEAILSAADSVSPNLV
ncbi:MAG: DNA repair protein RadA, partial [Chloroflexota bacterium]|nr:DNA repair protein RadA [Chloroflexota bacterium]